MTWRQWHVRRSMPCNHGRPAGSAAEGARAHRPNTTSGTGDRTRRSDRGSETGAARCSAPRGVEGRQQARPPAGCSAFRRGTIPGEQDGSDHGAHSGCWCRRKRPDIGRRCATGLVPETHRLSQVESHRRHVSDSFAVWPRSASSAETLCPTSSGRFFPKP